MGETRKAEREGLRGKKERECLTHRKLVPW